MPVPQVKIVNANGRVGYVSATYPPLVRGELHLAPSETREPQQPRPAQQPPSGNQQEEPEQGERLPRRNAPKQQWLQHAVDTGALEREQAQQMTRDELVAYFNEETHHAEDAG